MLSIELTLNIQNIKHCKSMITFQRFFKHFFNKQLFLQANMNITLCIVNLE